MYNIYLYTYIPIYANIYAQNFPKLLWIHQSFPLHHSQQVTNFNQPRRRLMEMLDVDGTATISYPEFIAAMTVSWWTTKAAKKN